MTEILVIHCKWEEICNMSYNEDMTCNSRSFIYKSPWKAPVRNSDLSLLNSMVSSAIHYCDHILDLIHLPINSKVSYHTFYFLTTIF